MSALVITELLSREAVFRPHQYAAHETHIDLYHVYDSLSRTPYTPGIGIECEDPNTYTINAWHVITPEKVRRHLNWWNREETQFISFYDNFAAAQNEALRRRNRLSVPTVGRRDPSSVRVAHIRLPRGSGVWAFGRRELAEMMRFFSPQSAMETINTMHPNEWLVWESVPEDFIVRIIYF